MISPLAALPRQSRQRNPFGLTCGEPVSWNRSLLAKPADAGEDLVRSAAAVAQTSKIAHGIVACNMRFGVVADDFSGACDSSAPFLAAGPVVVSFWSSFRNADRASLAVSTESRDDAPRVSHERSRLAAEALKNSGVDFLFRKVDSQMRGNVAADLAGTLLDWQGGCVLAPALPEEGRVTVGGRQRWAGGDVDVVRLLRAAGLEAASGSPADARPGTVVVCDATTSGELQDIADQIGRAPFRLLAAGSSGLASRLPAALGCAARPNVGWPACLRPIAIVGTPSALAQAQLATDRGKHVLVLGAGELPEDVEGYDGVFVTGGETASRILRWLGAEALELRGEVCPRVPVGVCRGGPHDGLLMAVKSGAFGPLEVIEDALTGMERGG